jgi:hypothetical protein
MKGGETSKETSSKTIEANKNLYGNLIYYGRNEYEKVCEKE